MHILFFLSLDGFETIEAQILDTITSTRSINLD